MEMFRRYGAAVLYSFYFQCLRRRMVNLEDLKIGRKLRTPQGEAIETRTDHHVLTNALGNRGFQSVFGVPSANDDIRIGGTRQKVIVDDRLWRLHRFGARPRLQCGECDAAQQVTYRVGNEAISPGIIDQRI